MAASATAITSILKSLLGGRQLGAAAPPFQAGPSLGVGQDLGGGGLFDTLQAIQQFAQPQDISSLVGMQGQELASQVRAQDAPQGSPEFMGPPQGFTGPAEGSPGFVGPPQGFVDPNLPGEKPTGPFGSFFGNLDQNLQSPSKVLGLGLLNQLDPRLAGLGLFAGGLFGQNKLF